MTNRRRGFNPKRRIGSASEFHKDELKRLAAKVNYCGNPAHKKNPGDFGLTPPSGARPGKSLCDAVGIFQKEEADRLLKDGVAKGLVSEQRNGDFPQNIWSVTDGGDVLEAQLENQDTGAYHGYPLPSTDPFVEQILNKWRAPSHA